MTTQHELIGSEALARSCPILRETALQIADPQVRYCGTIGGNVANGDPGNDMPAVMLCLDATYRAGKRERRSRSRGAGLLSGRLCHRAQARRNPHRVRFPAPPAGHGYAYEKLKRKIGDYATAAAAVILNMSGGKVRPGIHRAHQCRPDAALCESRRGPRSPAPRSTRPTSKPPSPPPKRSPRRPMTAAARRIPHQDGRRDGQARARERQAARDIKPRRQNRRRFRMAKKQISLTVNGKKVERAGRAAHAAHPFPARGPALTGAAYRLRDEPLRRLHGRSRRQIGEILHGVRGAGRRRATSSPSKAWPRRTARCMRCRKASARSTACNAASARRA